jgi:hypothetical protein
VESSEHHSEQTYAVDHDGVVVRDAEQLPRPARRKDGALPHRAMKPPGEAACQRRLSATSAPLSRPYWIDGSAPSSVFLGRALQRPGPMPAIRPREILSRNLRVTSLCQPVQEQPAQTVTVLLCQPGERTGAGLSAAKTDLDPLGVYR